MRGKELRFAHDARKSMLDGVTDLEKAVACTLGPKGRNVIIDNNTDHPVITKDGVSVAKAVSSSDPFKNLGMLVIKEAATKTNHIAGDGTTTATILAAALAKDGNALVSLGLDPNDVKKGFSAAKEAVLRNLDKYKRVVHSESDIFHIATISANNDEEIGGIIRDAFCCIGDNGIVNVVNSFSRQGKTEVKFSSGLEFKGGYISSQYSNQKDSSCEIQNPLVILSDKSIGSIDALKPMLMYAATDERTVVVIAPDFDEDVEELCVRNWNDSRAKCVLVKAPGYNPMIIKENITDLSVILDCGVLGRNGLDASSFDMQKDFGVCTDIKILPNRTTIAGANTNQDRLSERCVELKKKLDEDAIEASMGVYERLAVEEELAGLTGGVATIYIGADSDFELKEKKDRYEDAVHAVNAAINDGIAPGGGTALIKAAYDASQETPDLENETQRKGYECFLKACRVPCMKIIRSTGKNQELLAAEIEQSKNLSFGYNAKTETLVDDLVADGVIDPIKVVTTAVTYASSVASMFITVECVITDEQHNVHLSPADETLSEFSGDAV